MADLNDPVETGMPRSVKFGIAAVLIIIVFAWFLPKKAGNNNGEAGSGTNTGAGGPDANSFSDRETERQLAGILKGLSPELVVISSDRVARVAELGQWAGEAFAKGDAATVKIDKATNSKWFSGEALKEVNDVTFSLRDGHHLTLSMLAGDIVTSLAQKTADPLEQIEELFQIVVRQTTLVPDDHDVRMPGTPFESLLIGRATAASRAWAFGTLLRQLRLDAVILEPKSKPEKWLVGAITPSGDVLLFDPRLGTGLPVGPGPEGFKKVASLAQVKEKPDLLRLLDVENGEAYPLNAEDLANLNVKLITDSSSSAERMARLQTLLSGSLMQVFDGVGKSPLREQGLADRVITAGAKANAWAPADVAVWPYPEQQSGAFMSSGAEDSPAWTGINNVFLGPIILTTKRLQTKGEADAQSETVVDRTDQPLRLVRVEHLQGRVADALPGYGRIRDAALNVATRNPEFLEQLIAARPLNQQAAELAIYWIALCQLEMKPSLVQNTIQTYVRLFPKGQMMDAVPDLVATAFAANGDKAGAVRFLERGQQRSPRQEILIKQWKEPAASTPPASTPATPDESPAPKPDPEAPPSTDEKKIPAALDPT